MATTIPSITGQASDAHESQGPLDTVLFTAPASTSSYINIADAIPTWARSATLTVVGGSDDAYIAVSTSPTANTDGTVGATFIWHKGTRAFEVRDLEHNQVVENLWIRAGDPGSGTPLVGVAFGMQAA